MLVKILKPFDAVLANYKERAVGRIVELPKEVALRGIREGKLEKSEGSLPLRSVENMEAAIVEPGEEEVAAEVPEPVKRGRGRPRKIQAT